MDLIEQVDGLFRRLEKANKFTSRYKIYPSEESKRILAEMQRLEQTISANDDPTTETEVMHVEAKRVLQGEAAQLEAYLRGKNYDFDTAVKVLAIPQEDIASLRPWLEANRSSTLEAVDRLFQKCEVDEHELGLPLAIPRVRRQAEGFAETHIEIYHAELGKLVEGLTRAGTILRDIKVVATTSERSYFSPVTRTVAMGIPDICYQTEKGTPKLREHELIKLYGHEVMGHALHTLLTQTSKLPYFLRRHSVGGITAMESVAQHFQHVIFKDLANSPAAQKALDITHKFAEIYQDAMDADQIEEYGLKFFQYAITILADKNLGKHDDPKVMQRKIELLNEVAHDPGRPSGIVEGTRQQFDRDGNLSIGLVRELVYCSQPVKRAIETFEKQGKRYDAIDRSTIDFTLLTGFWTPIGYVQNAKVKASKN